MTLNTLLLLQNVSGSGGIELAERAITFGKGYLITHDGVSGQAVSLAYPGTDFQILSTNTAGATGLSWRNVLDVMTSASMVITTSDPNLSAAANSNFPTALAIKNYVDNRIVAGVTFRPPVQCVFDNAGASLPVSGSTTIDGVTVVAGLRVLVLQALSNSQKIMVASGSTAAWTWAQETDANGTTVDNADGATTWVTDGTVYKDRRYTFGGTTTSNTWIQTGGTSLYTGSNSISITSGVISAILKSSGLTAGSQGAISVDANGLFVSLGTTSTTAAAGNHTHTNMVTYTGTPTAGQIAIFSSTSVIQGVSILAAANGGTGLDNSAAPRYSIMMARSQAYKFDYLAPDTTNNPVYLRTQSTAGTAGPVTWSQIQASEIAGQGSVTEAGGNNVLSFSAGAATAALASYTITVNASSASQNGFLSSTNFDSFNKRLGSLSGGDVTLQSAIAAGGSGTLLIAATVVTGKLLTGYVIGTANQALSPTDSILQAFQKLAADKHVPITLASGVTQAALSLSAQQITLQGDLAAVENLSTNGIATRTASDTWTTRTMTGTANRLSITNGDGVSGNPTFNIDTTLLPSPAAGDVNKLLIVTAANAMQYHSLATGTAGTAPAFNIATNTLTLNIPLASATGVTAGLISKAQYDSFNSIASNGITQLTGDVTAIGPGSVAATIAASTVTGKLLTGINITSGTVSGSVSILAAIGYLANDKHVAVSLGTANGLSLAGQALSLQLASGSQPGALSAADWTAFNNKLTWAASAPTSPTDAGTIYQLYFDPVKGLLYICAQSGTAGNAKWFRFAGATSNWVS